MHLATTRTCCQLHILSEHAPHSWSTEPPRKFLPNRCGQAEMQRSVTRVDPQAPGGSPHSQGRHSPDSSLSNTSRVCSSACAASEATFSRLESSCRPAEWHHQSGEAVPLWWASCWLNARAGVAQSAAQRRRPSSSRSSATVTSAGSAAPGCGPAAALQHGQPDRQTLGARLLDRLRCGSTSSQLSVVTSQRGGKL